MSNLDSYAGRPIRSLQTMLRTIAQMEPNQVNVIPDGVYSDQTVNAVKSFQQRHHLPVTGVADAETWDKIVQAYGKARVDVERAIPVQITLNPGQVIRRGEENHKVFLIQTMLLVMSFLVDEIPETEHTGILDEQTQQAVLAFQLKAGLRPTGEVDKRTWKALALQFASASDELSRREGE